MAKPKQIELADGDIKIPILYEDRSIMAIDKPTGWMLAPDDWDKTGRNLQLALVSSINGGDFWAYSRQLKYLRYIHRLDAETTGVLLLAKSPGGLQSYSDMFENRQMEKVYWAVVHGTPSQAEWLCEEPLAPHPIIKSRMTVNHHEGKETETSFRVLASNGDFSLVEARPHTGRTHQIRVHLEQAGHPIAGDVLYGPRPIARTPEEFPLGLRAVYIGYNDPFLRRTIHIGAPVETFCRAFNFQNPGRPGAPAKKAQPK